MNGRPLDFISVYYCCCPRLTALDIFSPIGLAARMQVWTGVISTEVAGERVMDAPNGAMMYAPNGAMMYAHTHTHTHTHTHANDNEQQGLVCISNDLRIR